MDPDGQLNGDPVLDDAHAELCSLLDVVNVVREDRVKCPLPDQVDQPESEHYERIGVKGENGKVFVLLLPDEYHEDVEECKH